MDSAREGPTSSQLSQLPRNSNGLSLNDLGPVNQLRNPLLRPSGGFTLGRQSSAKAFTLDARTSEPVQASPSAAGWAHSLVVIPPSDSMLQGQTTFQHLVQSTTGGSKPRTGFGNSNSYLRSGSNGNSRNSKPTKPNASEKNARSATTPYRRISNLNRSSVAREGDTPPPPPAPSAPPAAAPAASSPSISSRSSAVTPTPTQPSPINVFSNGSFKSHVARPSHVERSGSDRTTSGPSEVHRAAEGALNGWNVNVSGMDANHRALVSQRHGMIAATILSAAAPAPAPVPESITITPIALGSSNQFKSGPLQNTATTAAKVPVTVTRANTYGGAAPPAAPRPSRASGPVLLKGEGDKGGTSAGSAFWKWFRAPSKAARVQCRTDPGQDGHARTRVDPVSHQGQGKRQNASSVYVDINAGPKLDPVESNGPVKRFFCRILCLTA